MALPAPVPSWTLPQYRRSSIQTDPTTNRYPVGVNEYRSARSLAWSTNKNLFYLTSEYGIHKLTPGGDCTRLIGDLPFIFSTDAGMVTNYEDLKAMAFVSVGGVTKLLVGSRMDRLYAGNTNGWIMEIDPETGAVLGQLALKYPPGGGDAGSGVDEFGGLLGLAQHPVTGVLYGIRKTDNKFARELVTINPVTGDTALVGNMGMHITGLTFVPSPAPLQISSITRSGNDLTLTWTGGSPPYNVQNRASLNAGSWATLVTNTLQITATITNGAAGSAGFFRVSGQ